MLAELRGRHGRRPVLEERCSARSNWPIDIVPGCEQAGISLLRDRHVETPASLGPLASACDRLQEQLGAGPCVTALREADTVRIDDVLDDEPVAGLRRGCRPTRPAQHVRVPAGDHRATCSAR